MKLRFLVAVLAMVISACTPPIGEDTLKDFGKRTDAVTQALSSSARVQQKMISETSEYSNVCSYLSGGSPVTAPKKTKIKPTKTALEMNQVAAAVGAYAKSLNGAAGGDSLATLNTAATNFKEVSSGLFGDLDAAPAVSPAVDAIVNGVLRLGEARRTARIRAIMEDVYPYLVILERKLVSDAPSVIKENRSFIADWDRASKCVLTRVRKEPSLAIDYYSQIRKDRAQIEKDVALAAKAPAAIRALFEAHILVITEPPDAELTLKTLQTIFGEIDAILEAGD